MDSSNQKISSRLSLTSVEEVKAAIAQMSERISENLGKQIFRDMLAGFKVLSQSIISKETEEACDVVIKWLQLYLNIQSNLQPNDDKMRRHFEFTVVPSVYFVISCLQCKPKNTLNYHYQLFKMIYNLLMNVKETTLQKFANLQAGVIACLWFPIDFVGDFNTQMMAFRLLVMILKSFDVPRQNQELATIKCARNKVLKEELDTAITVANYHQGKFENSADQFWIDLNYCPRTLSFTGRYRASKRGKFTNVTVDFKICRMKLENKTLTVGLKPPAHFSKKLIKSEILNTITQVKLQLPTEEAMRFEENPVIFEYYNNSTQENEESTMQNNATPESESSSDLSSNISDDLVGYNEIRQAIVETPPPSPPMQLTSAQRNNRKSADDTNQRQAPPSANAQPAKNHFEKSYPFIAGTSSSSASSNEQNTNVVTTEEAPHILVSQYRRSPTIETSQEANDIFKLPSLPKYEQALHNIKVSKIQKKKSPKKRQQLSKAASLVLSPPAMVIESPLTTREKYNEAAKEVNRERHPIARLSEKRRFFKTSTRSDMENVTSTAKNVPKPRKSTRKPKTNVIYSPTHKCKQVNKVKPMMYSQTDANSLENREIVNLTNFLDHGNESVAIFSTSQQRTLLQNVPRTAEHMADVYGQLNDSDAEPGQSYRNFQTRRNESPLPAEKNAKSRRRVVRRRQTKKSAKKIEPPPAFDIDGPSTSKAAAAAAGLAAQNVTVKRSKVIISDIMKSDLKSPSPKSPRLESHQPNTTILSGQIQIDLTCEPNVDEPVKRKMPSKKKFYERFLGRSSIESQDEIALKDHTVEPDLVQINEIRSKTPNEIQECRQANEMLLEKSQIRSLPMNDEVINSSSPEAQNGLFLFDDNYTPPIALSVTPLADFSSVSQQVESEPNQNPIQINTDRPDEMELDENLVRNDSILYCERSDAEDNSDSEDESQCSIEHEKEILIQTPTKITVGKSSTTTTTFTTKRLTSTSILTHQTNRTHFVSQQLFMEPTNRSRTSTPNILVEQEQRQAVIFDATDADEFNTSSEEGLNVTYTVQDSSANITDVFKQNVCSELVKIQQQEKETCVDLFMKKITAVSEQIMNEAQKESEELVNLQKDIELIVRQLEWQHQGYQKKLEHFQCFKENSKNLLEALSAIDIKNEIDREYDRMLEELKQSSHQMRTKLWREFYHECTDNLVKHIKNLSDLNC